MAIPLIFDGLVAKRSNSSYGITIPKALVDSGIFKEGRTYTFRYIIPDKKEKSLDQQKGEKW